ncbi:MAG: cell division protein SepF [Ruminococcaceae bacterium]|nr:cell division protein SepF [Oscillospiraceae bacterium]
MGLWDKVKNIMSIPEEDDYDEEFEETAEPAPKKAEREEAPVKRSEPTARVYQGGRSKSASAPQSRSSIQVVLVKPDRFDDVTSIADHLNDNKTVVLNLESADRDTSRRIVDFLGGAAYANGGNVRKVAKGTFIIVPNNVDVMGELMIEDYEDGKLYF